MNRKLALSLKLALLVIAFYIVFNKINVKAMFADIEHIKPSYLLLALISLFLSHLFSAFRMQYYYKAASIKCSNYFAFALYFVGMFYNSLLPGGISGDGYKIYIMEKIANVSKLQSLRLVLSNRASGLLALILITLTLALFSEHIKTVNYALYAIVFFAAITLLSYSFLAKLALKEDYIVQVKAAKYSFMVQLFSLISAYFLLTGMEHDLFGGQQLLSYLVIFMVSCVAAVLPISIGGAGIRELAFLYGADLLALNPEIGVAFSLIYFALNLIISLLGICFTTNLKEIYQPEVKL